MGRRQEGQRGGVAARPDGGGLEEAERAFDRGDFAAARAGARAVLAAEPDDELRARAEALVRRVAIDRAALALGVACALLIAVVAALTLGR